GLDLGDLGAHAVDARVGLVGQRGGREGGLCDQVAEVLGEIEHVKDGGVVAHRFAFLSAASRAARSACVLRAVISSGDQSRSSDAFMVASGTGGAVGIGWTPLPGSVSPAAPRIFARTSATIAPTFSRGAASPLRGPPFAAPPALRAREGLL